ncbi:protein kinase [Streptomyces sp. ISL-10]|uniref:protein kinase n=1 Tax=Streptomyces sp. ISL-10 TaxID=2819172 RepID=UPI001BE573B4|nr:protein kinase [Streptomyces sp. ISL-10]MBT2367839.1 protein kinase [Streptomyces sp. ISL-10]
MEDYAGRVLADRYRLPLPPSDEFESAETRAFDTYSGHEVLVRQVPLPEVVDAEVVDGDGLAGAAVPRRISGQATRRPADPAVRRAVEAAQAAAQIPDHPRLDQVFDVFAEDGSLWIVSEFVAARPLAALLAEKPLSPYRAAEVASDVLTALRVLHAHGWIHRNITVRTVLVCDDGRVVLTGLASGAAEEALCGYAPVPEPPDSGTAPGPASGTESGRDFVDVPGRTGPESVPGPRGGDGPGGAAALEPARPALPRPTGADTGQVPDVRAARAGAIAAYRAGARAAARVHDDQGRDDRRHQGDRPVQDGLDPDWWARSPGDGADHAAHDVPADDVPAHAAHDDVPGRDDPTDDAPGRARLAGTWHDGPPPGRDGPGPLSAGGTRPALPPARPAPDAARNDPYRNDPYGVRQAAAGHDPRAIRPALPAARADGSSSGSWDHGGGGGDALRADAQRRPVPAEGSTVAASGRWDDVVAGGGAPVFRGPATPLAAERARQARIAVVGAVTERWAPEQAGPVHENWQLAAPVGPATDLWALGALLFRAVQGHAPYPEESAAELVQLVCAEPPAFAEECGALRPVVESLLRQDPTDRPDFEELRGWLRSLVRSAPEPEAGMDVVPLPAGPVDASRLPVVRRRGELVRRRRSAGRDVAHGRHRHKRPREAARPDRGARRDHQVRPERQAYSAQARAPRALGRTLLLLILLAVVAAVAYAVLFMPKSGPGQSDSGAGPTAGAAPSPDGPGDGKGPSPSGTPGAQQPQTSAPAANLPDGYVLREDPEGFRLAVAEDWRRSPINDAGQVRYADGDFTLIVVPGRDPVSTNGDDPLVYQRDKERELQPFRDSSWAGASGLKRIDVGQQSMAEGQFTWQDSTGREVFVRNLALIVGDRYHVIQVIGPADRREEVTEIHRQAATTYRVTR